MKQKIPDEMFTKKGRMKKNPVTMTPDELKTWETEEAAYILQHLFSIGQPLVYKKDGALFAEYADGRIEKI